MKTFTPQIPSNLFAKGITKENLVELQQKENAALTMCGGLLGNCYLLGEIAENKILELMPKIKKTKWYRQDIKFAISNSRKELHTNIQDCIRNSPSNDDYMRAVADATSDVIWPDLEKLAYTIELQLKLKDIPDADIIAHMVTIDIIFKYISVEYRDVLKHMCSVYKPLVDNFYESWFYHSEFRNAAFWWNKALISFALKYVKSEIDLNKIQSIQDGIIIIQKHMNSIDLAQKIADEASKWATEGNAKELYENARNILEK